MLGQDGGRAGGSAGGSMGGCGREAEGEPSSNFMSVVSGKVVLGQTEGVEHDGHIAEAVRASARGASRLLDLNHSCSKHALWKYRRRRNRPPIAYRRSRSLPRVCGVRVDGSLRVDKGGVRGRRERV